MKCKMYSHQSQSSGFMPASSRISALSSIDPSLGGDTVDIEVTMA